MRYLVAILKSRFAPWLLAAVVSGACCLLAVWFGSLNQDEGWYLYAAQMVAAGKLPYHDFFFTQGPTLPIVYAALSPIWTSPDSILHGVIGGRVVTLLLGFLATACGIALVRRLVPVERRGVAALSLFAVLSCNVYHVYFTTIPKTYALGSFFVLAGFLLIACGLSRRGTVGAFQLAAGGLSLALATGTRISLLLILPVVGFTLLFKMRTFSWAFLWFGLGGALGLFLTYGLFALDPVSLKGLLAAQSYHAARGGFDPFFALGSLSRVVRGYGALGAVLFAAGALAVRPSSADDVKVDAVTRTLLWMLGLGFAAVLLLQLSAPFPYDDYQVPIMGLLAVVIVAWFARQGGTAWFAVLAAGMMSFSAPQVQEWMTYGVDRFWSLKKDQTELAKLRTMAREVNVLDPGGTTLFTQDLYLAIEAGRTVPPGLEMGPFSYFPELDTPTARAVHVLNRELMKELIAAAPSSVAACSGYTFAIAAPTCAEVSFEEQRDLHRLLKERYDLVDAEENFGQNATTLLLLKRREGVK